LTRPPSPTDVYIHEENVVQRHTVDTVMTQEVVSVYPNTSFKEIAELLSEHDISAVPVADFQVAVHEGVVTLMGQVERRSQVAVAATLVHRVTGVVDVTDRFTYAVEDSHPAHGTGPGHGARSRLRDQSGAGLDHHGHGHSGHTLGGQHLGSGTTVDLAGGGPPQPVAALT
jgi:hypothetical protein